MNQNIKTHLISALVASVVCSLLIGAYHFVVTHKAKHAPIVINLPEVVDAKEKILSTALSKPGISDTERGAVYDQIKQFGSDIEREIGNIQVECNCMVFSKGVLLAEAEDKTEYLKKRLGL